MSEFQMPMLGADMEAGTLARWVKAPGDTIARGDIVAVVETEKGAIEIEAFDEGILERVLVAPGQKVPVGTPLAIIRRDGESADAPVPPAAARPRAMDVPAEPPAEAARPRRPAREARRPRASPAARNAAEVLGVELSAVTGTGPQGAITKDDVERAAPAAAETPAAAVPRARVDTAGAARSDTMRAAIAAAMSRSKREIPHFYMRSRIEMTPTLDWLAARNRERPVTGRVLPAALLLKAVARAVKEVPEVNGFYADGRHQPGAGVHVGCAIAVRDGLVAPAIHDVDGKSLDAIMTDLTDLVARARRGGLRSSELSDPTITVTNLGDLGVEEALAVIYPPQVAIVAFGQPVERPWVVDGQVDARTVMTITLSVDHRVIDGRKAARFLSAVASQLQHPEDL